MSVPNTASASARPAAPPRYQSLAAEIQSRIQSGRYPLGAALPTEQELCAEFGVSRHTVREALRRLVLQGLVRRRQGSGTEVIAQTPPAAYLHAMRSLSELFEYAADTVLEVRKVGFVVPDDETAAMLGRRPGRRWLQVEGVRRSRAGAPINFNRVWIHDDFAALAGELPSYQGMIYQLLENRFGARAEEVVQEFTAEPMPAEAAAALGLHKGAPAVRLMRRYLGEGDKPLIVSLNWHPAATFRYAMRLRREEAGAVEGRDASA